MITKTTEEMRLAEPKIMKRKIIKEHHKFLIFLFSLMRLWCGDFQFHCATFDFLHCKIYKPISDENVSILRSLWK